MPDRERMLDIAERFRTYATQTSSLTYAGMMLQVAQDLEVEALTTETLAVKLHHQEADASHEVAARLHADDRCPDLKSSIAKPNQISPSANATGWKATQKSSSTANLRRKIAPR